MLGDRFQVSCGPQQVAFGFSLSTEEVLLFCPQPRFPLLADTFTANDGKSIQAYKVGGGDLHICICV